MRTFDSLEPHSKTHHSSGTDSHNYEDLNEQYEDLNEQYEQEIHSRVLTYSSVDGRDEFTVLLSPRAREADDRNERGNIKSLVRREGRPDANGRRCIPNVKIKAV